MKHLNWLVKALFYKHEDKEATQSGVTRPETYYNVGYMDQQHANLCSNASENMLYHLAGKPFASMAKNPRGLAEPETPNESLFLLKTFTDNGVNASLTHFIQTNMKERGPFVMCMPLKGGMGHSVVVTGYDKDNLIYHDPMTGPNRVISWTDLHRLVSEHKSEEHEQGELEISVPHKGFYPEQVLEQARSATIQKPEVLYSDKYAKHFSIEKMEDPAEAIKVFLKDYAENSKWKFNRHHRQDVSAFLEENKNVTNLEELVQNLTEYPAFKAVNQGGELDSRIKAVKEYTNMEKMDAFKDKFKDMREASRSQQESAPSEIITPGLR